MLDGRGGLYKGEALIYSVSYIIRVLQELVPTRKGKPPLPGLERIVGFIDAPEDFFDLIGQELTLHLEDGRYLDCIITDIGGRIEGCGKGIYTTKTTPPGSGIPTVQAKT